MEDSPDPGQEAILCDVQDWRGTRCPPGRDQHAGKMMLSKIRERFFGFMSTERNEGGLYRSRRAAGAWLAGVLTLFSLGSCQTVPITGRMAPNLFSIDQDIEMGAQAYEEMMAQENVLTSGPEHTMVNRVMDRLVVACGEMGIDPGFDWEVRVIQNDQVVNAWALPGGKMAVYTGILPVAQSETGLAVVMGHELGHALARHGTQRLTSQGAAQLVIDLLAAGEYRELAGQLTGVLQPGYGRNQELESDHIGLILMARAGYDPSEAAAFWERMSALSGGAGPPEWLSTHPSHDRRISQIQELLPEAMTYYGSSGD